MVRTISTYSMIFHSCKKHYDLKILEMLQNNTSWLHTVNLFLYLTTWHNSIQYVTNYIYVSLGYIKWYECWKMHELAFLFRIEVKFSLASCFGELSLTFLWSHLHTIDLSHCHKLCKSIGTTCAPHRWTLKHPLGPQSYPIYLAWSIWANYISTTQVHMGPYVCRYVAHKGCILECYLGDKLMRPLESKSHKAKD